MNKRRYGMNKKLIQDEVSDKYPGVVIDWKKHQVLAPDEMADKVFEIAECIENLVKEYGGEWKLRPERLMRHNNCLKSDSGDSANLSKPSTPEGDPNPQGDLIPPAAA